ncbi:MAG: hypothetical protein E7321_07445 [Clostridiales bacterium]|nr:hypothetical protein [Clostridiales bacterium]
MKKKIAVIMMVLALALIVQGAFAEEFTTEKNNALAAAKVSLPEAVVDYTVRERDDGRYEWDLFFTQGNQIGECEVLESTNEIRKVTLYEKPAGALTASEAMALLAEKKGAITIIDLELDRDNGSLRYEGEAELDGKRYEFEMRVTGEIIEWERD